MSPDNHARLRAYEVLEPDGSEVGSYGFVVASDSQEARRIAFKTHPDPLGSFDGEYIRVRVRWIRNAQIDENVAHHGKGWYDWEPVHVRLHMLSCYVDETGSTLCDACGRVAYHLYPNKWSDALCDRCAEVHP